MSYLTGLQMLEQANKDMHQKVMKSMTGEEKQAYMWALNHDYQSMAARYARTLAKYILKKGI